MRALLAGTKTQTRRALRMQGWDSVDLHEQFRDEWSPWKDGERHHSITSPYGKPGDRLWVRETWADLTAAHGQRWERFDELTRLYERGRHPFYWYRADGDQPGVGDCVSPRERWRSPIHMPRWASRITLEITDVRVQRLQDISDLDAIAEGVREHVYPACGDHPALLGYVTDADGEYGAAHKTARGAYAHLWDSINREVAWRTNPWVWVLTFRRIEGARA